MDPDSADKIIFNHRNRMYVSFFVNSIATVMAVLVVLKYSPKNMGMYKYILLDIVVSNR